MSLTLHLARWEPYSRFVFVVCSRSGEFSLFISHVSPPRFWIFLAFVLALAFRLPIFGCFFFSAKSAFNQAIEAGGIICQGECQFPPKMGACSRVTQPPAPPPPPSPIQLTPLPSHLAKSLNLAITKTHTTNFDGAIRKWDLRGTTKNARKNKRN